MNWAINKIDDIENSCGDSKKACELGDCNELEILQESGRCPAID